ncbi:hypothetical protein ACFL0I_04715 [Gemmatimonadota bacterium]
MKNTHDSRKSPDRVREPVQVYLDPSDRERLERLRDQLTTSKSDVLRRGLEALERELTDPDRHPAMRIIGIAQGPTDPGGPTYDVAREHDRFLSVAEVEAWERPGKRGGRGR